MQRVKGNTNLESVVRSNRRENAEQICGVFIRLQIWRITAMEMAPDSRSSRSGVAETRRQRRAASRTKPKRRRTKMELAN